MVHVIYLKIKVKVRKCRSNVQTASIITFNCYSERPVSVQSDLFVNTAAILTTWLGRWVCPSSILHKPSCSESHSTHITNNIVDTSSGIYYS